MYLSGREFTTLLHGGLGVLFLLGYAGGMVGLFSFRPGWMTTDGRQAMASWISKGTVLMAGAAWLTVASAIYIVNPWYRATPPDGTTDLTQFPRALIRANPNLVGWQNWGMEWKEHPSSIAPILATAVAFLVIRYGPKLVQDQKIRSSLMGLLTISFVIAGIAALFGAMITKVAPIR